MVSCGGQDMGQCHGFLLREDQSLQSSGVILLAPSFYYRATKKALPRVCEYEVPRIREPFGPALHCLAPEKPGMDQFRDLFLPPC